MIIPGNPSIVNPVRGSETADKGAANDVSAKYKVVNGGNIVLPPVCRLLSQVLLY